MSQITTHVLDTSLGRPAAGVPLQLSRRGDDDWTVLASGVTDADGRVGDLLDDSPLPAGTYRMYFDTARYFELQGERGFYPWVEVVFEITGGGEHYHIPLLLSPYGYSTYRGS